MTKKATGTVYVLLAAIFWSFAGIGVKYIPWHPLSISCVRGIVAAITIACLQKQWKIKLTKATVMAAACVFVTTILFMFANKMTSAANAIVLQYTSPIFVLIASTIASKSKFKLMDICTVCLTLLGITLFFMDSIGVQGNLWGDILALLSGVTFAGVFFVNGLPSANPKDASLLGCAFSIFLLPMLFTDGGVAMGGWQAWVVAILLGTVQQGLAYYFFAKGVSQTGSVTASIICTAEPILNPLWVFLIMKERPGVLSLIGGVIVVATIAVYNIISIRQSAGADSVTS